MNNKLSMQEEQRLIKLCKADLSNFSKIYQAYVDDLYKYVVFILNDKQKAEDIVSETFITALEKVKDFRSDGISIKSWLIKIARNHMSNYFRVKKEVAIDNDIQTGDIENALNEDIAIEAELVEKLKVFLDKLDTFTKEVISLRIWEELQFNEIAEVTGENEGTVKTRFYRGVEKLKEMAKEDRDSMKLASLDVVGMIVGVKAVKDLAVFTIGSIFKQNLLDKIISNINLLINNKTMDNQMKNQVPQQGSTQAVGSVGSSTGGAMLGAAKVKLIIAAIIGVTVIGGGAAGVYILAKDDAEPEEKEEVVEGGEEEEQDDEPVSEDPYEGWKECENVEWGISIKHPEGWECNIDSELKMGEHDVVLQSGERSLHITDTYAYSPSPDSGCKDDADVTYITTLNIGGNDIEISHCDESSLPGIFYQITYDFDTTPPGIFYLYGIGFDDMKEDEIQELKMIIDSIEMISDNNEDQKTNAEGQEPSTIRTSQTQKYEFSYANDSKQNISISVLHEGKVYSTVTIDTQRCYIEPNLPCVGTPMLETSEIELPKEIITITIKEENGGEKTTYQINPNNGDYIHIYYRSDEAKEFAGTRYDVQQKTEPPMYD